jgi:hypothetical protein
MKSVFSLLVVLCAICAPSVTADRLNARALKEDTLKVASSTECEKCPADVAAEAFVSMECCKCVKGWEVVTVDESFVYCVESSVLLDETALRLLATFTANLVDSYLDENEHDEEEETKKAKEEGAVYVTQGTAEDIINREASGDLPVFARINTRDYRRGASARYNKISKDLTVGAAQEANFVKIRTLFPFEKRFQSLNDKRITTQFEDKPGKHPGFKKMTTKVNQNSAIEIAAVAFVPTFTVN